MGFRVRPLVDPFAYLRGVLTRIADHPINRIDLLLPWVWAAQVRPDMSPRECDLDHARRTNLAEIVSVCGRSGVRSTRDSNSAYRPIRSVTLRK